MEPTFNELEKRALSLPPDERARLAESLLGSMPEDTYSDPVERLTDPVIRDPVLDHYRPQTEIGRMLLALRRAYLERGGKLMTQDEILADVRRRRGEADE
jgi:hypothetical protein